MKVGCLRERLYKACFDSALPQDWPLTLTLSPKGEGIEAARSTRLK
jgi:hypothetical protein